MRVTGACVAGLKAISNISPVPPELITNGEKTLYTQLPKESKTKNIDLSMLSLLYPFNTVNKRQYLIILNNISINNNLVEQYLKVKSPQSSHLDLYFIYIKKLN